MCDENPQPAQQADGARQVLDVVLVDFDLLQRLTHADRRREELQAHKVQV